VVPEDLVKTCRQQGKKEAGSKYIRPEIGVL